MNGNIFLRPSNNVRPPDSIDRYPGGFFRKEPDVRHLRNQKQESSLKSSGLSDKIAENQADITASKHKGGRDRDE